MRLLIILLLLLASPAWATNYFISTSGSNGNAGTSAGAPWATFTFAKANGWGCGDTLFLADGTYTNGNSGMVSITSTTCTAGNEMVLQATNERQAHISHDGNAGAGVFVSASAYIHIVGIHVSSADNDYIPGTSDEWGEPLAIYSSNHVQVRRSIFDHNNRYGNNHLVDVQNSNDILLEDNEGYFFHRHAFAAVASYNVRWTRNYCHSRGVGSVGGGHQNGLGGNWPGQNGGDDCIIGYPVRDSIAENNVCDGLLAPATGNGVMLKCIEVEASGEIEADGNQFYGNIGWLNFLCVGMRNRDVFDAMQPHNTLIKHNACMNTLLRHYQFHGAVNTTFDNNTALDPDGQSIDAGMQFIQDIGPTPSTFTGKNNLATDTEFWGFYTSLDEAQWTLAYSNFYNNAIANLEPSSSSSYSNITQVNPQLGGCYLWIPSGSPMQGAGQGGADIGATVLYRYESGVLTSTPLWDTTTAKFPCGAVVTGLNDVANASCQYVHTKLHVNSGGCAFPAGYGTPSTASYSLRRTQGIQGTRLLRHGRSGW